MAAGRMTKAQIITEVSEKTKLTKKEVGGVFEELTGLVARQLGKKGPGIFVLPGLLKLRVVHKPATKEREGINPFTGQKTTFKAKPARKVVRASALKALKDMVQ